MFDPRTDLPPASWHPRLRPDALWATRRRGVLVIAAVAVLLFATSLLNGFAYDDVAIIQNDPRVRGFQLLAILGKPYWATSPDLAIYRPLTTLTFALDWLVSRGMPWFFHAINVLEHGVASALVFLVLAELAAPAAAFAGALVFAIHPVHVEAVSNVVGRAEVLSAVFYLAAMLVWARAASPTWRRVGAIGLLYVLALLTKESSATLPAALVLMDAALGRWALDRRTIRDYLRRVLPVLLACGVILAAFLTVRYRVLGREAPGVYDPIFDLPMTSIGRVLTALQTWPVFARLVFFPRILLADYSPRILMPAAGWTLAAVAGLAILLALATTGLLALRRGHGRAAFAALWFPLTMLPVSNLLFPIGIIVAERTLYLPLLALGAAAALVVEHARRLAPRARRLLAVAGVTAGVLLCVRTLTRIPVWDSTNDVFYALSADRPDSFRAEWHLARIARNARRTDLALARYHKAIALWPFRPYLITEALGVTMRARRYGDAVDLARYAVARWPYNLEAQRYLATAAYAAGDSAAARTAARAGLRLSPADTALLRVWRGTGAGEFR